MKTKKLICESCGGTMEVDADKSIISCPYCGSKELIEESDEVKIAKIKADAEVRKHQIDTDADLELMGIKTRDIKKPIFDSRTMMMLIMSCAAIILIILGYIFGT